MKFLRYFLLLTYGHKKAKHFAFHEEFETWEFIDLKKSDCLHFWDTRHQVKCSKCDHKRVAKKALFVKGMWFDLGSDEHEAIEDAKTINQYS